MPGRVVWKADFRVVLNPSATGPDSYWLFSAWVWLSPERILMVLRWDTQVTQNHTAAALVALKGFIHRRMQLPQSEEDTCSVNTS